MSERSKKKFPFFKISKFFFEKWLQWDVANVDRNKLMKFELILSIRGEITRDHLPGGVDLTPPCRIGLKFQASLIKVSVSPLQHILAVHYGQNS